MLFTKEEWDVILFLAANELASNTGGFSELDKIYQSDPIKCYEFAKRNLVYNGKYMCSLPLEFELKTSHMLGVIMLAEEDISIKEKVIKQLKIRYPASAEYYENPTNIAKYKSARHELNKRYVSLHLSEMVGLNGVNCYLISYFHSKSSAEDKEKMDIWEDLANTVRKGFSDFLYIENREADTTYSFPMDQVSNELHKNISCWSDVFLFNDIKNAALDAAEQGGLKKGNYFLTPAMYHDFIQQENTTSSTMQSINIEWKSSSLNAENYHKLVHFIPWDDLQWDMRTAGYNRLKHYLENPENQNVWMYINAAMGSITNICYGVGFISTFLFLDSPLTKKEQAIILSSSEDNCSPYQVDPTKYVYNLFLLRLLQIYKKTKDQYFQDNQERILSAQHQETQELTKAQKKIRDLEKKTKQMSAEMQRLRKENEKLNKILQRQKKEGEKPFIDEIQRLKGELEHERSLHYDLTALREFVFSLESSEDLSEDADVPLQKYLQQVNIALLGGHDNLRKKLKQLYPDTMILDGTQETIDLIDKLQGIDILFLFTDHMNHSVYNNAINAAQRHQIKLAYIHATNAQMIEAQISTQIKQYLS